MSSSRECGQKLTATNDGRCFSFFIYRHFLYTLLKDFKMKAILEFNLPEEEEQFNADNKGMDWALLVWHIDQFIQNKIKYEQDRDGVLQLVRNELNFQMEEKDCSIQNKVIGPDAE